MRLFFLLAFALPALAACDSPTDPPPTNGPDNAPFAYECATETDAFCTDPSHPAVPTTIALGSSFGLIEASQPVADITLSTPSANVLTIDADQHLHAIAGGLADVVATAKDGTVVGYVEFHVVPIASIDVDGIPAPAVTQLGTTLDVHGTPRDPSGATLAGSLAYAWESSDPTVVAVDLSADDVAKGTATLRPIAPGTTVIRVSSGGAFGEAELTVGGAP